MVENLDDIMKTDIAGIVKIVREHGPDSEELRKCISETSQHYPSKESVQEYKELCAGLLLLMYDQSY